MTRPTLVPALKALALSATATAGLSAADVGGLTIGGFVDTWLEIVSYGEDAAPAVDNNNEPDDLEVDFVAEVELQVGYKIGSNIAAQIDLEYYGDGGYDLETATITWQINDTVSLMMGEFVDWLGWEAADAPGRYRVNRSILVNENYYGTKTVTGAGVGIAASDKVKVGIYITDHIYGETGKELADLALGGDLSVDLEGYGNVNFEFGYDINAAPSMGGAVDESIMGVGVNTTFTGMEKLVLGGEFHYLDYELASKYGFMAMANYKFQDDMSGTLMIAYAEPNDDADDDNIMEVTAALLTNPTKDANFALNFEVSYITPDSASDADLDTLGIYVEMLAVIP